MAARRRLMAARGPAAGVSVTRNEQLASKAHWRADGPTTLAGRGRLGLWPGASPWLHAGAISAGTLIQRPQ
eukprot:3413279-Pyramimonas_sp.AAC.1